MAERFPKLAFNLVVMFLGWLYLAGITIILYLTFRNGASLLIRDSIMPFEIIMLIIILIGMGTILIGTLKHFVQEYWRIIKSS